MKIIMILYLSFFTQVITIQDKKSQIIDELLTVTKTKESLPLIVNSLLTKFRQSRNDIPANYWKEIRNEIDYTLFMTQAKELYRNNYTLEELEEMVSLYKYGDIETYKLKSKRIESELYEIGNDFGKETVQYISQKVKAYSN